MAGKNRRRRQGRRRSTSAFRDRFRRMFGKHGARRTVLAFIIAGAVAALAGLAWIWPRCSGEGCPSVETLRAYTPPQASRVYDMDGDLLAHLAPERRIVVPLEEIPAHVSGAFLAVEDRRFFEHDGIDYRRVVGAALHDLRTLSFDEGFSTITMQLARNVFPDHLTRAKTLRRKVWEIMLARQIEAAFAKDEILEMYLNQIYLGEGLYGVEAAAQGYFGKSVRELTAPEAAMLAALPKAPSYYSPRQNPVAAVERRNLVLSLMADVGVISAEAAENARSAPLGLAPPIEASGSAPYFVAAVRHQIRERFGPGAETAGLRIYTTVNPELQRSAEEALRAQIEAVEAGELGRFRHDSCSDGEVDNPADCLQGMFVAMDARTGAVRALVGGREFSQSQFNRVTQARRQAGSAFKPIVYAAGLASGIPITTTLIGPGAETYEGDYHPADHVADTLSIDLREGLRMSSNRAAVALGTRVGVTEVVQTAHTLGLSTPIEPYPSTFLGAADVIPLELVAAYSVFANGGMLVEPRLIQRVENSRGQVLWESKLEATRALSPGVAYLTLSLMKDVVDEGTGYAVRSAGLPYSVPAAGKTGTTDESADVWFIGVTPDLVAGVWMGFDQPERIMSGASGGMLAAPVWGQVMADYYQSHAAPADWAVPPDLITVQVDATTGLLATSACPPEQVRMESFLPGTEPVEHCRMHPEPGIDGWLRRMVRGIGDLIGDGRR